MVLSTESQENVDHIIVRDNSLTKPLPVFGNAKILLPGWNIFFFFGF